MVTVIRPSHSMHRIFNYNENKVKEGVAECIGAENFPLDAQEMSLKIKLGYLLKRTALRKDIARKHVHISLNFDPSETHLSKEKLAGITKVYMEKLGFGEQPYLIYQHHDAGHPHLHIVTTNILANGNRIDLHHLGIRKSEPARKEIEKMFGLVVANTRARREVFQLQPVNVKRAQYGRTETKRAITNVLDAVLYKYRYTSLPELNAVLKQYNVMADRGDEDSRIFKTGGLVYRILDEEGKPIGVPIKASDFYNKPTWKFLKTKFGANEPKRQPHKARIKNEIDKLLLRHASTLNELQKQLAAKGIDMFLHQNEAGLIYGVTYVDHKTLCVFNGSALGKPYSAKAIQQRCLQKEVSTPDLLPPHPALKPSIGLPPQPTVAAETKAFKADPQPATNAGSSENVLGILLQPESASDYVPQQLKKKKKKKKKKNLFNNR